MPAISSISPTTANAGGAALTVIVTGSNFVSGSEVQWNNTALATTYQSASSLTAQLPAADLASAGTASVTVSSPAPGGGTSSALTFAIDNPAPVLSSISPASASSGAAGITLTATGSSFINGSQLQWNGAALTTTFVSSTQLTAQITASLLAAITVSGNAAITVSSPTPGGGASSSVPFAVNVSSTNVTSLSLPINHLVWDATHASLYASLAGTASNANTIVAINPATAAITATQPAGTNPDILALAQDNSFLYAGSDGTNQILRYSLPSLTPDPTLNIQFPNDPTFGPVVAIALAVAPAAPHTVAAIRGNWQISLPNTGGTVIYDDSTPRTTSILYYDESENTLAWGANASVLYGGNSLSTSYDLFVNAVTSGGVTLTQDYEYLIPEQYGSNHFDPSSGHIYSDGGRVVDPATGNIVGTFDLPPDASFPGWLCAPDLANGRVFFLGQTESQSNAALGVTLEVFDAKSYQLLQTLTLATPTGYPIDFVRWGNAGLAFTIGPAIYHDTTPLANTLYILDGSFVSSTATPDTTGGTAAPPLPNLSALTPQSASAGTNGATITVNGANYSLNSQVAWNGTALQTTYVSATELQAAVPAADLASSGSALVTVSNGSNQLTTNSLTFTITPASGATQITAENLAALDIAWDASGSHLIAPVWSADTQYANSIVAIDPSTGNVVQSVPVDPDPDLVRVTGDDTSVYTAYSKVNAVTQLTLPNLAYATSFNLGADPYYGPYFAIDLQPAPGADATTAVALGFEGASPDEAGVAIFDNGTPRPDKGPAFGGSGDELDILQWGGNDSTLYAADQVGPPEFYTLAVGPSGATLSQTLVNVFAANRKMLFDATTGYVYSDAGQVLNPNNTASLSLVGSYNASGLLVVDSTLNRVFILGQTSAQSNTANYTLQSFNQTQFTPVSSITLSSVEGTPVAMTRWGANGLAFVTYNPNASATNGSVGMLYILSDTSFVSASERSSTGSEKVERVHAVPAASPFTHSTDKPRQ